MSEASLRLSHERALAVIQGDPDALLALESDGTVSVRLDPIIAAVRDALVERGVELAEAIPEKPRQCSRS